MDWDVFMTTMSFTGIGATTLCYLAKELVNAALSRDLERFKVQLKADSEKELEQLRTGLRMASFEREVQFSKLHEERANVIAEVYRKLDLTDRAFHALMSPIKIKSIDEEERAREDDELARKAADSARAFLDCYNASKIYFDEELCKTLDRFSEQLWNAWINFQVLPSLAGIKGQIVGQSRSDAWKTIIDQVQPIRREIESAFRKLLGHSHA